MTYLDGYIFPRTIQAIEDVLFKAGYTVQIAFTNNLVDRERKILEDILQRDEVAGVMVEATKSALPNPNIHFYRELMERKIPVLFINCYYKELPLPHVAMNDRLAGKAATEYLIKKGHKKITGIFKLDDGQGHLRYAGFGEALQEARVRSIIAAKIIAINFFAFFIVNLFLSIKIISIPFDNAADVICESLGGFYFGFIGEELVVSYVAVGGDKEG